jgi:hypothetical protein
MIEPSTRSPLLLHQGLFLWLILGQFLLDTEVVLLGQSNPDSRQIIYSAADYLYRTENTSPFPVFSSVTSRNPHAKEVDMQALMGVGGLLARGTDCVVIGKMCETVRHGCTE